MIISSSDRPSAFTRLENCVGDVKQWMISNGLMLNNGKTEILHITSCFIENLHPFKSLRIGSAVVEAVSKARNLGLLMDNQMTLSSHVDSVCQSANLALRKIGQIRKHLNLATAEKLVHAFVSSRLDYCNSILYGLPDYELRKLQHVQNTAARMVALVKKRDHISPVLRRLHWLPVKHRITFKVLLLTYKALHGLAPCYITELLQRYIPTRTLRSGSKALLTPVSSSTSYGARSFAVAAPALWNDIPLEIRNATSVESFKSMLKTHLFNAE